MKTLAILENDSIYDNVEVIDPEEIYENKKSNKKLPKVVRLSKVAKLLEKGKNIAEISKKLGLSKSIIKEDIKLIEGLKGIDTIDENTKMLRRIEIDSEIDFQIGFGKTVMEKHQWKSPRSVAEIMKVICSLLELRLKLWKLDSTMEFSASEKTTVLKEMLPDELKDKIADSLVSHLTKEIKVSV